MTVLGTAEVLIVPSTAGFAPALEAETQAAFAGVSTGAAKAGQDAGTELRSGVKTGAGGIAQDLADVGAAGGVNLRKGVSTSAGAIAGDLEKTGKDAGDKFASGIGTGLTKVGTLIASAGIPLPGLASGFTKAGAAAKDLDSKSSSLGGTLSKVGGVALVGLTVGLAGAAAGGVHLAETMQTAETQISSSAGITQQAAVNIGNAFVDTAGKSEFSGEKMAQAYALVAGQLTATQGQALSTQQAMTFMGAATDLASAKQIDLGTATSTVSGILQAFQLDVSQSSHVADVLFSASNATGQSIDTLGGVLEKTRTKLGAMSPPLSEMTGLLVDMTNHGETGRAAMSALQTTFTTLLKPAEDITKAEQDQKTAFDALPPSVQNLVTAYNDGQISAAQLRTGVQGLSADQQALVKTYSDSTTAVQKANTAQQQLGITVTDSNGKFVGMQSVIAQLSQQIQGMTTAQATAKLEADGFGTSASKLLTIIQAGPQAYAQATDSVNKYGAAHAAAEKQSETLRGELATLGSEIVDEATKFGTVLIPVVTSFIGVIVSATSYVLAHKSLLEALAVTVGTVLAVAIATFTVNKMAAFKKSFDDATGSVKGLLTQLGILPGKTDAAGNSAQTAGNKVNTMGDKSETAGGQVSTMGTKSATASGEVQTMGNRSATAAGEETELGTQATAATTPVADLGGAAATAGGEIEAEGNAAATAAGDEVLLGENAAAAAPEVATLDAEAAGLGGGSLGIAAIGAVPFASTAFKTGEGLGKQFDQGLKNIFGVDQNMVDTSTGQTQGTNVSQWLNNLPSTLKSGPTNAENASQAELNKALGITPGMVAQSNAINAQDTSTVTTAAQLTSYLMTQGYNRNAASALAGNVFGGEDTTGRSNIVQGGGTSSTPVAGAGYGLGQWTDPSRQAALVQYAAAHNLPVDSVAAQEGFMAQEASGIKGQLNAAPNASSAALIAENEYESPKGTVGSGLTPNSNASTGARESIASALAGGGGGAAGGGGGGGTLLDKPTQQQIAADAKAGDAALNTLLNATHSGSLKNLGSALDSTHLSQMQSLVQKLDSAHVGSLTTLANKIETAYKSALDTEKGLVDADTKAGNAALVSLVGKTHETALETLTGKVDADHKMSLAQLNAVLDKDHTEKLANLVTQLNATHNTNLVSMASKIESAYQAAEAQRTAIIDADTKQGQTTLGNLVNATTSGSLTQLNTMLNATHVEKMDEVVNKLFATHNSHLDALGNKIEAAYSTALQAQTQAIQAAANTAINAIDSMAAAAAQNASNLYSAGATLGVNTASQADSAQLAPYTGGMSMQELAYQLPGVIAGLENGTLSYATASQIFGGGSLGSDFATLNAGTLSSADQATLLGNVESTLNTVSGLLSKYVSDATAEGLPGVPALAAGGIIPRPMLALLGEQEEEAVIPLSMIGGRAGLGGKPDPLPQASPVAGAALPNGMALAGRDLYLTIEQAASTLPEVIQELAFQLKIGALPPMPTYPGAPMIAASPGG